jgi:hypothetical protein
MAPKHYRYHCSGDQPEIFLPAISEDDEMETFDLDLDVDLALALRSAQEMPSTIGVGPYHVESSALALGRPGSVIDTDLLADARLMPGTWFLESDRVPVWPPLDA